MRSLKISACISAKGLPPIEAVTARSLTPADGESNDPEDEKDGCCYPQKMHCETSPK
jgi:hypothetical protein